MARRVAPAVITFNDVPAHNPTFKYEVLGRLAIENRRRYCARHGYDFIETVPVAPDRPACWAKLPALLAALESYPWVLWADSDALIFAPERRLEPLCDPAYDLIVQSHEAYFRFLGVPLATGLARMPINTGVFLIRSSPWSRAFLARAYEQTQFVSHGELWDGIGEQEAMTALLQREPADLRRIGYVDGLQNHPRFYRPGDLFVHFYGNYAQHRLPLEACAEVFVRWGAAVHCERPLPDDRARFHWCCIQNKVAGAEPVRGDLGRYLYEPGDIAAEPVGA
ncbi:MAG TPA: hypothetical protein VMD91_02485 [Candidatus Sulfotelmatobacter sp.]|nr:hypothetical protein [Candidatus Sulfotelmatobacter sp.]